eukprot:scaffold209315_cov21-Tisochrysis_lutea.AAC.2
MKSGFASTRSNKDKILKCKLPVISIATHAEFETYVDDHLVAFDANVEGHPGAQIFHSRSAWITINSADVLYNRSSY